MFYFQPSLIILARWSFIYVIAGGFQRGCLIVEEKYVTALYDNCNWNVSVFEHPSLWPRSSRIWDISLLTKQSDTLIWCFYAGLCNAQEEFKWKIALHPIVKCSTLQMPLCRVPPVTETHKPLAASTLLQCFPTVLITSGIAAPLRSILNLCRLATI